MPHTHNAIQSTHTTLGTVDKGTALEPVSSILCDKVTQATKRAYQSCMSTKSTRTFLVHGLGVIEITINEYINLPGPIKTRVFLPTK